MSELRGPHPSHKTRFSDASSFDEICENCGATDQVPGGWGALAYPCPNAERQGPGKEGTPEHLPPDATPESRVKED